MTKNSRDDPKHWLDRAAKARVHAEQISGPESKRMMLGIAENYETLARQAEQRFRPRHSCMGNRDGEEGNAEPSVDEGRDAHAEDACARENKDGDRAET
jgi:hypothetical protein